MNLDSMVDQLKGLLRQRRSYQRISRQDGQRHWALDQVNSQITAKTDEIRWRRKAGSGGIRTSW